MTGEHGGERTDGHAAGARAAVLARLWGAFTREPLHGIARRHVEGSDLVVTLADGRALRGSAAVAQPFARAEPGFRVMLAGRPIADPADLLIAAMIADAVRADQRDGAADTRTARLAAELRDSVTNLAAARAAQPAPHGGPPTLSTLDAVPDSLAYLEQSIVDGHPLHPLCRTRIPMSAMEVRAYGPEHRPIVDLATVAVPADRWRSTGTGLPPRLIMHPWQRDHVLAEHPALTLTGERHPARPLMSLRSLAPIGMPRWHLKTAVDVQMTSAVRTVSPAAIHNGPLMSALLAEVCAGTPLGVLTEPAAGAVLVDGEPSRSLAIVYRRAPSLAPDEIAMPFAVLCAPSPASGRALVTEAVAMAADADPVAFFADLMTLTLPTLLRLLHLGVALEAHGQNTLLVLRAGRPVRLLYRDMGGVRVSYERLASAGIEAPRLRGDLGSDDPDELRAKLAAAFLATVVAELVVNLGREYAIEPSTLWQIAAGIIRRTYHDMPVTARGDRNAMLSATLPCKAMTAMRLSATVLEDIWTPIANPMAGLG